MYWLLFVVFPAIIVGLEVVPDTVSRAASNVVSISKSNLNPIDGHFEATSLSFPNMPSAPTFQVLWKKNMQKRNARRVAKMYDTKREAPFLAGTTEEKVVPHLVSSAQLSANSRGMTMGSIPGTGSLPGTGIENMVVGGDKTDDNNEGGDANEISNDNANYGASDIENDTEFSREPTTYSGKTTGHARKPTGYSKDPTGYSKKPTGHSKKPNENSREPTGYNVWQS